MPVREGVLTQAPPRTAHGRRECHVCLCFLHSRYLQCVPPWGVLGVASTQTVAAPTAIQLPHWVGGRSERGYCGTIQDCVASRSTRQLRIVGLFLRMSTLNFTRPLSSYRRPLSPDARERSVQVAWRIRVHSS